jgi:uncharacterized protein YajQ (UPF0234 family)
LATRATCQACAPARIGVRTSGCRIAEPWRRTVIGWSTRPRPASEGFLVADPSFDVVSKVDRQEVDNAVNQAAKEIATRYDFKGVGAAVGWSGSEKIDIRASSEERAKAVLDVLREKLVKRRVSLKAVKAGDPRQSGKEFRIEVTVDEGISDENAKKIAKLIRSEGPKGVQAQIQGDQLRVTGKKKDDLQTVIAMLREADLDIALQFTNYR